MTYQVNGTQYVAVFAAHQNLSGTGKGWADSIWIFALGGTIPAVPSNPLPLRVEIPGADVAGSTVGNTVELGRTWTGSAPSAGEVLTSQLAGNTHNHCVTGFFADTFASGQLAPGQSYTHSFGTAGEYYYDDCDYPASTGVIDVR